ncbi:hypothetical protein JXI42_01780, partial [bacterium]|nr:hypothetical protein [bacterium]
MQRCNSGGIYIVGPDISPDSLTGDYFYYSADYGSTLVLKYIDPTGCVDFCYITSDLTIGGIYRTGSSAPLYYSTDFGESWALHNVYCPGSVCSGLLSGEIYKGAYYSVRSADYGVTFADTGAVSPFNVRQVGRIPGELYGIYDSYGRLYYSDDYGHSFTLMHDFDRGEGWDISRGATAGEIYAYNYDTIYYSSDHGETFTRTGCYAGGNKFNEIAGGNNTGELFGLRRLYNEPPMGEWGGGEIEIC